jgi:SAM-dependent methyltransferase
MLLDRWKPRSVVDIGSNTGWFSILAARKGASVVSLDVDEASVDRLFQIASSGSLDVLPLVVDATEGEAGPLLDKNDRLSGNTVLALGLVHHLVLGKGLTFDEVAGSLSPYSTERLLIEFVGVDDPLIASEPEFFPTFNDSPRSFDWYTLEGLVGAMRKRYENVQTVPSHPNSRSIVVCESLIQ